MRPTPSDHPFDLNGKIALVTGGGRGIGKAISLGFARAGAGVAVHYYRNPKSAEETVRQIKELGGQAEAVQADVSNQDDTDKLIPEITAAFGCLDIVINNAGIYPLSPLTEMTLEEWEEMLSTNLRGAFLVTQAAGRQMILQGNGGAVINIASIEGISPAPGHSHYSAAKGGLIMFTKASASELGKHGIRVNAVSPGLIWRPGLEEDWPGGVQRYTKAAPLQRIGQPEDIANACLFLASPAASWITGTNLVVDGGVLTHQTY
jgi:NAD(P)-dependent dehydrogenase (short-subunit alcohol dehydrogenase family)